MLSPFLFQIGTIKSQRMHRRQDDVARFYSKLVRLKVNDIHYFTIKLTKFLFQIGTIKSDRKLNCQRVEHARVSIPNWYD